MGLKEYLFKSKYPNVESKTDSIVNEEDTVVVGTESKGFVLEKLNEILDEATNNFFPKEGTWLSNCFRKPKEVYMGNLPCHLRDNEWLAEMLRKDQELGMISSKYVLNYIENSEHFKEARHNYELEIVKWQINWMRNGGEGWIVDDEYGGDFINFSPEIDLGFRKGVVDTLTAIGMNREVIEEGIEKNANLWRDSYMSRAFGNEFDSVFLSFEPFHIFGGESVEQSGLNKPSLPPINKEHKEAWLKLRRYEYYQRHKDSVDKYGVVLPEMKLDGKALEDLKSLVSLKNAERKQEIEEYEAEKERIRVKRYGSKK